jgi:hypothetical protein
MKKKPNKLQIKKLFKEFGYLKADEEYKSEFVRDISPEFQDAIRAFLKDKPELNALFGFYKESSENNEGSKEIQESNKIKRISDYTYEESAECGLIPYTPEIQSETRESSNINDTVNDAVNDAVNDSVNKEVDDKDQKIKKLYRQIATRTHPDKVKLKFLNDIYLKAKTAYQAKDLFSIYLICNDLDIEYKLDDNEVSDFDKNIKALRHSNSITELTYLWIWYFEEDLNKKMKILQQFIITNPQAVRPIFN